jgi:hypothetical protein
LIALIDTWVRRILAPLLPRPARNFRRSEILVQRGRISAHGETRRISAGRTQWGLARPNPDQVQYVYGFDTQFDADEWIEREASEWVKLLHAKLGRCIS